MIPTRSTRPGRLGAADVVTIAAAMASLIAACLIVSAKKFAWSDEEFTRLVVSVRSTADLWRILYAGLDSAPPFYHLVAHGWSKVFGDGETALRLLTSICFAGALALLWATLRRVYGWRATAVGVLTIFCTSGLLLHQNAELRFYGLLTLLVVAAFALYMAAGRRKPGAGLLAGTFALHVALVMTHFFGGLFSAAIFGAAAVREIVRRRWWWQAPAAIAASWLVFLTWLHPLRIQADVGKPRHWSVVPQLPNLLEMFQFDLALLPLILFAVVALAAVGRALGEAPAAVVDEERARGREDALLAAFALMTVPVITFVVSRIGTSVFVDRYMLPSIVAWGIVLAHLTEMLAGGAERAAEPGVEPAAERGVAGGRATRVAWGALAAGLALWPLVNAKQFVAQQRPGEGLEQAVDSSTTVVVEQVKDLLPLLRYSRIDDERLLFPLDWPLALDPTAPAAGVPNFKVFRMLREHGFAARSVVDGGLILCRSPRFYVLHDAESAWLTHRILADSAYTTRDVGADGDRRVVLVERRPGAPAPVCPASPS